MKILVFGGSGKMGSAVAWDLAKNYQVEEVGIIGITDRQENTLKKIKKWINSNKIVLHAIDVNNRQETMKLMERYDVGAIALPDRKYSYKVVDMAIDTELNTVDILEEYHRKPDKYEVEGLEIPSGMTLNEYGESLHQNIKNIQKRLSVGQVIGKEQISKMVFLLWEELLPFPKQLLQ